MNQWQNIIAGIPKESIKSMIRLAKYLLRGSFDSPSVNKKYTYVKSSVTKSVTLPILVSNIRQRESPIQRQSKDHL